LSANLATRIHPCPHGVTTQQWPIRVEAGAVLLVLPGPSIPFAGWRYCQRVAVALEPGASFVWGDVGLAGCYARVAARERFRFAALVQECQVRRAGRLAFRGRFSWQGPWPPRDVIPPPFENCLIVADAMPDAWPCSQRHAVDCWKSG
jgi:urease accessory protein UreH